MSETARKQTITNTRRGVTQRWTRTLIPTTREAPNDAETPSHVLLHRAGYIRQVGAGVYDYLPLSTRVLDKVSAIVREEMDAAGASELLMPHLEPVELFAGTKRDVDYGPLLFTLEDRKGRRSALAPTHEEVITELMKGAVTSYKQLPLNLYQIQTKFRDEARPRAGLLRCREFVMKDAYSFHTHVEGAGGLNEAYDAMYRAYTNIFTRCGLDFTAVEAESGPIGGSASHEFMVNCASGEDTILKCPASGYAANVEKCEIGERPKGTFTEPPTGELTEVHTPNLPGIDEVGKFMKVKPDRMLKTIVFFDQPAEVTDEALEGAFKGMMTGLEAIRNGRPGTDRAICTLLAKSSFLVNPSVAEGDALLDQGFEASVRAAVRPLRELIAKCTLVMAVVRGDHEVNEGKLKKYLHGKLWNPLPETLLLMGIPVGYISPAFINRWSNAIIVVDHDASGGGFWATGANKQDYHVKHFNWRREVGKKLDDPQYVKIADVRNALAGDPSPRAKDAKLETARGIEVGHIFKLGTKYSDAMGFGVMGADQKKTSVIMGCYGIGVSRTMAACVEMSHDENGIVWPAALAPFHVLITMIKHDDAAQAEAAKKIAGELNAAGVDVLIDDRDERPGVKFKDADLVGIPLRITLGEKALAQGGVEFKARRDPGKGELVPLGEAAEKCVEALNG